MDTQNVQTEITRHLCQAHAVQIKSLQSSLPDLISQTTKALEENHPELAQSLWKQVVQTTQNISHLFNQTANIMYQQNGSPTNGQQQYGNGRRFTGSGYGERGRSSSRGRGQQFPTKQLNRIARQVDELVAAGR